MREGANIKRCSSALTTQGKQHVGMNSELVRVQLRYTTQKHYEKDDLPANLRDAMKAADFEGVLTWCRSEPVDKR